MLELRSFIGLTTISVFLRFFTSLIIFKILYQLPNKENYISDFNQFLNYFNIFTIIGTLNFGKIFLKEKLSLSDLKNHKDNFLKILILPFLSVTVIFIVAIIMFFNSLIKSDLLLLVLLLYPNLLSHLFLNSNNVLLKHKLNNVITIVTFLLINISVLFCLYFFNFYSIFKFTYIIAIIIIPIIFFKFSTSSPSVSEMLSLFKELFNYSNIKIERKLFIDFFSHNFVYLNPILIYFIHTFFIDNLLDVKNSIKLNYEILFRGYSIIISLMAVIMVSYIIPKSKINNQILKINPILIVFFFLIIIPFSLYFYYFLITSKFILLNDFLTLSIIIYFIYKVFEFSLVSIKIAFNKMNVLQLYFLDLVILIVLSINSSSY